MRSLILSKNWFQVFKPWKPILRGSLRKRHGSSFRQQHFGCCFGNLCRHQEVTANLEDFYLVIEDFERNVQEIETIATILKFQVDSFKF